VFDKMTKNARLAIAGSQDVARELGYGYVGTEHILISLAQTPGSVAAQALAHASVVVEQIRHSVVACLDVEHFSDRGEPRFTSPAKQTLVSALNYAVGCNDKYIGTKHLLVALIDNPADGQMRRIFPDFERVRNEVLEYVGAP
jgi:ATP-dependent Clp protease ATP-binding subunit ClpC